MPFHRRRRRRSHMNPHMDYHELYYAYCHAKKAYKTLKHLLHHSHHCHNPHMWESSSRSYLYHAEYDENYENIIVDSLIT